MAKASKKSPEEKLGVVLSVLRGEQSAVDAGRRAGVSEQTVHNWKKLFLDSERTAIILGDLVVGHQVTANLMPDAMMAALAIENGLTIISADTDFARFTEARWENPLAQ